MKATNLKNITPIIYQKATVVYALQSPFVFDTTRKEEAIDSERHSVMLNEPRI